MSVIRYREVNQPVPAQQVGPPTGTDNKALELVKRALELPSLDNLYFLLTNDMRALLEFDRCSPDRALGRSIKTRCNKRPTPARQTGKVLR